ITIKTMIGPIHQNTSDPVRNTNCEGSSAHPRAISPSTHRYCFRSRGPRDSPAACTETNSECCLLEPPQRINPDAHLACYSLAQIIGLRFSHSSAELINTVDATRSSDQATTQIAR